MLQELDSALAAWVIIALCTQQHFTSPYSNYADFSSLRLSLCLSFWSPQLAALHPLNVSYRRGWKTLQQHGAF